MVLATGCRDQVTVEDAGAGEGATPHPVGESTGDPAPRTESARPSTSTPSPTADPSGRAIVTSAAVPVLCRAAWGAREPLAGLQRHRVRRVMLHHSAVRLDDPAAIVRRLRQHQDFHVDERGWPDIAYHRAVGPGGHVFELRDLAVAGDTATEYDPAGSALVLVEGDFDRQDPTDEQVEAAAQVTAALLAAFDLEGDLRDTVTSHRDHATTSCPGDRLYARLGELRDRVAELLAGVTPELVAICGDEAREVVAAIEDGRA